MIEVHRVLDSEETLRYEDLKRDEFKRWKNKLKTILHTTRYCSICAEEKRTLYDIDATVCIREISKKYNSSFRQIISALCLVNSPQIFASSLICDECAKIAIQSTIFTSKIKTSAKILQSCLKKIEENIDSTFNSIYDFDNYDKSLICFDLGQIIEDHKEIKVIRYKCHKCLLEFMDDEIYKKHLTIHIATETVNCAADKLIPVEVGTNKKTVVPVDEGNADEIECDECKAFVKKSGIDQHKKLHAQKIWNCSACDKVFYSASSFSTHLIMKHNILSKDSIYTCSVCYKSYLTKETLNSHKCKYRCSECPEIPCLHEEYLISFRNQKEAGNKCIKCPKCSFACPRKSSLISHVNIEHLNFYKHFCRECDLSFHTKQSLAQHKSKFHKEMANCDKQSRIKGNFEPDKLNCKDIEQNLDSIEQVADCDNANIINSILCFVCNGQFENQDELKSHVEEKHNTKISCTMCFEDFFDEQEFSSHVATHPANTKHICRQCNATFNSKFNHRTHLMNIHGAGKVTCEVCKRTIHECNLESHMQTHSTTNENNKKVKQTSQVSKCDLCEKWFSSIKVLKRHKIKHKEEVQCVICMKFLRPINMEAHLLSHKNKVLIKKKLKCSKCEYVTNYPLCMDAHKNRIHAKVRPYKCCKCVKSFYGKITLHEHMKSHSDTSITGRQCEYCGEYFCNSFSLRTHMRLHTGEKPYTCDQCGESFISASRRKEHILKRHTTPSIPCPICKNMYFSARDVRAHMKKIHLNLRKGDGNIAQIQLSEEDMYIFKDNRIL